MLLDELEAQLALSGAEFTEAVGPRIEAETSSTLHQDDLDPEAGGNAAGAVPLDQLFHPEEPGDDVPEPDHRSRPGIFPLYGAWPRPKPSRGYLSESAVRLDPHEPTELLRYPFRSDQGLENVGLMYVGESV